MAAATILNFIKSSISGHNIPRMANDNPPTILQLIVNKLHDFCILIQLIRRQSAMVDGLSKTLLKPLPAFTRGLRGIKEAKIKTVWQSIRAIIHLRCIIINARLRNCTQQNCTLCWPVSCLTAGEYADFDAVSLLAGDRRLLTESHLSRGLLSVDNCAALVSLAPVSVWTAQTTRHSVTNTQLQLHSVHWATSLFGLVFRSVQNSDWVQSSAKNWSQFFCLDLVQSLDWANDWVNRWVQSSN